MKLLLVLVACAAFAASACGPGDCGDYQYEFTSDSASYPTRADEDCGTDGTGALGSWSVDLGTAILSFSPADGPSGAYQDIKIPLDEMVEGAVLEVPTIQGEAFTGLGGDHTNVAALADGATVEILEDQGTSPNGSAIDHNYRIAWSAHWTGNADWYAIGEDDVKFIELP